jgi:hypothetical protein
MIFAFDIATRSTGWCVGDGAEMPVVDYWQYEHVGDYLSDLARVFRADLNRLEDRFGSPTHVVYEAPILTPHDRLLPLRKIYGMGMVLEEWATDEGRGAICEEIDLRTIKSRLTGSHKADKSQIVKMARAVGIRLPPGDGAKDAADAFGAWLAGGVDHHAKQHQQKWDTLLYTGRGRLV